MTTYKDNDLREALRRKYNDTPQLPADFMKRMQKSTPKPTRRARHIYIAALAAAACIALVVMMVWPTNGSPVSCPTPKRSSDMRIRKIECCQ